MQTPPDVAQQSVVQDQCVMMQTVLGVGVLNVPSM